MSIFKKVIIIFSIVVAISIFTTFLILHFIILESFIELEKKSAVENVKRAAGILSDEISVLRNQNDDWASWDGSYEFINNANEEYIKSNLIDETFIILKQRNLDYG